MRHEDGAGGTLIRAVILLLTGPDSRERERLAALAQEYGAELRDFGAGQPDVLEVLLPPKLDEQACAARFRKLDSVRAALTKSEPAHLVARGEREDLTVAIRESRFGGSSFSAIAGPCSVEDYDSVLALALAVRASGATALRGGAFKPRTSPYVFQGLGRPGLEILQAVGKETNLAVVTEVLDTRDVDRVAEHADALQIGSRNMMNYALLREAGRARMPILLKRGMSATIEELLLAAEHLAHAGATDILLCERGVRSFDPSTRNLLDLAAVPVLKTRTHLPVLVDPSHGTGRADLVAPMMAASAAVGADGILVEVHGQPARALSDSDQALTPQEFHSAITTTRAVINSLGRTFVGPSQVAHTP